MAVTPELAEKLVVLGKITTVYGVQGWVKVHSFTEPMDNLLQYRQWRLRRDGETRQVDIVKMRVHSNGIVAQIKGVDDREVAREFAGFEILLSADQLPKLAVDEYYWHQLIGLKVTNQQGQLLGQVHSLQETGANDVMLVKPCSGSLDGRERMLPYLPEQFVLSIDLAAGEMLVDWDADF